MAVNTSREAWKTYGNVFDEHSEQILRRLAAQGYFEELTGAIALGKEANVFSATTKEGKLVAVKIYRVQNCNFNKMYEYISQDPRYLNLRGRKRRIIFAWTQREFRNMLKAREHTRVPTPIAFKDNILVMEYINEGKDAAPQLKDAQLQDPQAFFDELLQGVRDLYLAGLIHGDLSAYNVLVQQQKPVFIDLSQTTATDSPQAKELLKRDLDIISVFFKKQGIKSDPEELFKKVTSA